MRSSKGTLKTYHFIFIDIVGLSKSGVPIELQVTKIENLNKIVNDTEVMKNIDRNSLEVLPTGDGMAIGIPGDRRQPVELAMQVQKELKSYNSKTPDEQSKVEVRIGLNSGDVYVVPDIDGKPNIWGLGIVHARRAMDLGDAGCILATRSVADLRTYEEKYKRIIKGIGRWPIKRGEDLEIFNVYNGEVGNKTLPPVAEVPKPRLKRYEEGEYYHPGEGQIYEFIKKTLELRITSLEDMKVHHKLSKTIKNKLGLAQQVGYFTVFGDTDKEWGDLNLMMCDDHNNIIDPLYITLDLPRYKGGEVLLPQPLLPGESLTFSIEWDWEEPICYYSSRFPFECPNFEFSLVVSKEAKIALNVYRVEGEKKSKIELQETPEGEAIKFSGNVATLLPDSRVIVEWDWSK